MPNSGQQPQPGIRVVADNLPSRRPRPCSVETPPRGPCPHRPTQRPAGLPPGSPLRRRGGGPAAPWVAAVAPARPQEPLQRARPKAQGRQALGRDGRRGPVPGAGAQRGWRVGKGGGGGRWARSPSPSLAPSRFAIRGSRMRVPWSRMPALWLFGARTGRRNEPGRGPRQARELGGDRRQPARPFTWLTQAGPGWLRKCGPEAARWRCYVAQRQRILAGSAMSASLLCSPRLSRGRKG